jgi:hypothetical protein
MVRVIKDDATPREPRERAAEEPGMVAQRLRSEMRFAVGSLRERLPEAFARSQQRRRDPASPRTDRAP